MAEESLPPRSRMGKRGQHRSELYWAFPRSPTFHSGKFPVDAWMGRWMHACMDQCGVLGSRHRMDT